ncbi:MAG: acetyl-CoA carboxylase biotin carboxyl carrier protein subunit [Acidobacteriota bacterium]
MKLVASRGELDEAIELERLADGGYRVRVGDRLYVLDCATAGHPDLYSLVTESGHQFEVSVRRTARRGGVMQYAVSSARGVETIEVTDPLTRLAQQAHGGGSGSRRAEALMPGRVVEILVAEGDEVAHGQGVVVVEAMKMKNEIQAESDGRVAKIFVAAGENVEGGDPLFELE